MTQTALANAMKDLGHKWSQPTVVAIEKGERPLRLSEARDIAVVLGIEIADLIKSPTTAQLEDAYLQLGTIAVQARLSLADWRRFRVEALQLADAYLAESPAQSAEEDEQARALIAKIKRMAEHDSLPQTRGDGRESVPEFLSSDISDL